jgi:predicted nucleic acid-binding protein
MVYHLDTDFLVYALSTTGPERRQLRSLADSDAEIQMSAVAWYEFARGPRTSRARQRRSSVGWVPPASEPPTSPSGSRRWLTTPCS